MSGGWLVWPLTHWRWPWDLGYRLGLHVSVVVDRHGTATGLIHRWQSSCNFGHPFQEPDHG